MPHYLVQVTYSSEGSAAIVEKPQNRIEDVRPVVELGGKVNSAWFSFGKYDAVLSLNYSTPTEAYFESVPHILG